MALDYITRENSTYPFSSAVIHNGLIYTAGHVGTDPETGTVPEGIAEQTHGTIRNLERVLKQAGSSLDKVIKVNIYLTDVNDFPEMNAAYREFFSDPFPARTTVAITALAAPELIIEIEMTAALE